MGATWYLWPVNNDPDTNKYLAKVIGEQNPEDEMRDKLCADGIKRNLFRCPQGFVNVRMALAAVSEFNLKIEVFKESFWGTNAKGITHFVLWKKSVRKKLNENRYLGGRRSRPPS